MVGSISRIAFITTLCFLLIGVVSAAEYVGEDACKGCHKKIYEPLLETGHPTDCEKCHGPGSDHLDSDGNPDDITNPLYEIPPENPYDGRLNPAQAEICGQCHKKHFELHQDESGRMAEVTTCVNCHSLHNSDLDKFLVREVEADNIPNGDKSFGICSACHSTKIGDHNEMPQFHVYMPAMVDEDGSEAVCVDCHMRGGGRHSYVATEEGCLDDCHKDKDTSWAIEEIGTWKEQATLIEESAPGEHHGMPIYYLVGGALAVVFLIYALLWKKLS